MRAHQAPIASAARSTEVEAGDADSCALRRRTGGRRLPQVVQAEFGKAFGCSFGAVEVVEDERAAAHGAQAVTDGTTIHFAPGCFDPKSDTGRFLLAHELAHVVQQSGAARTDGPVANVSALEAEADEVAALAARGLPVSVSGRAPRGPLCFNSNEHRHIGELAAGATGVGLVELAPGYSLPFSAVVAMAGDFFLSIDQMRRLAANPAKGANGREELDYVHTVKVLGQKKADGSQFSAAARDAADRRFLELAMTNGSHFARPTRSDGARSDAERDGMRVSNPDLFAEDKLSGPNAGANYQENHRRAIVAAIKAGASKQPIGAAMAQEAFADHFLTDAFAAGHIRSERNDIATYWNAKVPLFFLNFVHFAAEQIARHIHDDGSFIGGAAAGLSVGTRTNIPKFGSMVRLLEILQRNGIPPLTLGDLIAAAEHDYDNVEGVTAMVENTPVELYGDGTLLDTKDRPRPQAGETSSLAARACITSIREVQGAYEAAQRGTAPETIGAGLQDKQGLFAAERLIPQPVADGDARQKHPSMRWDFATLDELLADPRAAHALKVSSQLKAGFLESAVGALDGFQRQAFHEAVLAPLRRQPLALIRQIAHYVPHTNHGAFSDPPDGQAKNYLAEVRRYEGGLASLSVVQKRMLLAQIVDLEMLPSDEQAILEVLGSDPSDAPLVISGQGWRKIWLGLSSRNTQTFVQKFGSTYWQTRSFEDKLQELQFLQAGYLSVVRQETVVTIFRTLSNDERMQLRGDAVDKLRRRFDEPFRSELQSLLVL